MPSKASGIDRALHGLPPVTRALTPEIPFQMLPWVPLASASPHRRRFWSIHACCSPSQDTIRRRPCWAASGFPVSSRSARGRSDRTTPSRCGGCGGLARPGTAPPAGPLAGPWRPPVGGAGGAPGLVVHGRPPLPPLSPPPPPPPPPPRGPRPPPRGYWPRAGGGAGRGPQRAPYPTGGGGKRGGGGGGGQAGVAPRAPRGPPRGDGPGRGAREPAALLPAIWQLPTVCLLIG